MTKNYFLLVLILISQTMLAQNIEIGAGAGSGAFYLIEEIDDNSRAIYEGPASLYMDFKYNFNGVEGVKLRMLHTSVMVEGQDYQSGLSLNGTVDAFSFLLLYERLRADKKFNVGYNFGLGHTIQNFNRNTRSGANDVQDRFMSLNFTGIASLQLSDRLRLKGEAGFLWTDPINSLRGSDYWQTAGEDLSFLVQLGLSYSFLKDEQ
ncbi:hypothetical protein BST97_00855 [Nonlabens spongiae]|uniref:Outer membrane protein beta-barrel domain-containing protein n=1 Tax=Nonlabens spongiae TaxID=331648 RepID=A0A1W6MGN8_9FLAO|nr:hypothetical protein [Nonlabens spongiae]ARN76666.1 hypothetical protein BST97_00855 [Nonlabens spongiae]